MVRVVPAPGTPSILAKPRSSSVLGRSSEAILRRLPIMLSINCVTELTLAAIVFVAVLVTHTWLVSPTEPLASINSWL